MYSPFSFLRTETEASSQLTLSSPSSGTPPTVNTTVPPPHRVSGEGAMEISGVASRMLNVTVPTTVSPTLTVAVAVPAFTLLEYSTEYPSVVGCLSFVTAMAGFSSLPVYVWSATTGST